MVAIFSTWYMSITNLKLSMLIFHGILCIMHNNMDCCFPSLFKEIVTDMNCLYTKECITHAAEKLNVSVSSAFQKQSHPASTANYSFLHAL